MRPRRVALVALVVSCALDFAWVDEVEIEVRAPGWAGSVWSVPEPEGQLGVFHACTNESERRVQGSFEGEGLWRIDVETEGADERAQVRLDVRFKDPADGRSAGRTCYRLPFGGAASSLRVVIPDGLAQLDPLSCSVQGDDDSANDDSAP
jgi:hypothetical protein